jgi:hypothetical protein
MSNPHLFSNHFQYTGNSIVSFIRKKFKAFDSVADPGSGASLTPGSGMEKNPETGIRDGKNRIRVKHPGSATLAFGQHFTFFCL